MTSRCEVWRERPRWLQARSSVAWRGAPLLLRAMCAWRRVVRKAGGRLSSVLEELRGASEVLGVSQGRALAAVDQALGQRRMRRSRRGEALAGFSLGLLLPIDDDHVERQ